MKSISLSAASAALAFVLSGQAQADPYFVNITELSSTQLSVSMSFPDYTFTGTLNPISSGPEEWALLPAMQNRIQGASLDNQVRLSEMAWIEPGSNPSNLKYNVFVFGWVPSGSYTNTYMLYFSDMTADAIAGTPGIGGVFAGGCASGGLPTNCPVLTNAQTQVGIPLLRFTESGDVNAGLLNVTVNDRGDIASAVPEVTTWAMLLLGFAGVGFMAYRRKSKPALMAA